MSKTRKILLVSLLVSALFVLGSMITALLLKDVIIERTLRTIASNNQISLQAKEVKLVLFEDFPNVMLEFTDARITPKKRDSKKHFEVEIASFKLSVDILRYLRYKEVEIVLIKVQEGSVLLDNPSLVSGGEKGKKRKMPELDMEKYMILDVDRLELKDIDVRVKQLGQVEKLQVHSLRASMNKTTKAVELYLDAGVVLKDMGQYRASETVAIKTTISSSKGYYATKNTQIAIGGNDFLLSGDYGLQNYDYKLDIKSKKADPQRIMALVEKFTKTPDLNIKASKLVIGATVAGNIENGRSSLVMHIETPRVELRYGAQQVYAQRVKSRVTAAQMMNPASYLYRLEMGRLDLPGITYTGRLEGQGVVKPKIEVDGTFEMLAHQQKELAGYMSGKITGDIKASLSSMELKGVDGFTIKASSDNLSLNYQGRSFDCQGTIEATKNGVNPQLSITSPLFTGTVSARIANYWPQLVASQHSQSKPALEVTGRIDAEQANIDSIVSMIAKSPDSKNSNSSPIRLSLRLSGEDVTYQGYQLSRTSAQLFYSDAGLLIKDLKAKGAGGHLEGVVELESTTVGGNNLYANLDFSNINIEQIDYVNQLLDIEKGQLLGTTQGKVQFYATMQQDKIVAPSIQLKAKVRIDNGKLVDFKPLQSLSRFIKPALLREIAFNTIENEVTIARGVVTLPRMEVRSTALNTIVSGKHHLDGDYDYRLAIFLSDIFRRQQRDINNPITDGQSRIFLQVQRKNGTVEARYDKEALKSNITEKLQKEVDSFKTKPNSTTSQSTSSTTPATSRDINFEWDEEALHPLSPSISDTSSPSNTTTSAPRQEKSAKSPANTRSPHVIEIEWEE